MEMGHLVVKEKKNKTKSPVSVILNHGENFKTGVLAEITLLVLKRKYVGGFLNSLRLALDKLIPRTLGTRLCCA